MYSGVLRVRAFLETLVLFQQVSLEHALGPCTGSRRANPGHKRRLAICCISSIAFRVCGSLLKDTV